MKCQVTNICERSLGDGSGLQNDLTKNETRSPFKFGKPFGNRGSGGLKSYMWKAEDGSFAWEIGEPPVKCGEWFER